MFVFLSQCNCACLSLFVFNVCVLVLSSSSPMSPTNTIPNRVRESRPFLIATDSIYVYMCVRMIFMTAALGCDVVVVLILLFLFYWFSNFIRGLCGFSFVVVVVFVYLLA